MTRGGGGFASGKNAVAICERCAKKLPYLDLVKDGQYPDMNVCSDCYDPKHPQEYLPDTFDPVSLYDPTGDPERNVAGGFRTISFPWMYAPPMALIFGVGVGLGTPVLTSADGVGDSFDAVSFSTDSFDTSSFDL